MEINKINLENGQNQIEKLLKLVLKIIEIKLENGQH